MKQVYSTKEKDTTWNTVTGGWLMTAPELDGITSLEYLFKSLQSKVANSDRGITFIAKSISSRKKNDP